MTDLSLIEEIEDWLYANISWDLFPACADTDGLLTLYVRNVYGRMERIGAGPGHHQPMIKIKNDHPGRGASCYDCHSIPDSAQPDRTWEDHVNNIWCYTRALSEEGNTAPKEFDYSISEGRAHP